MHQKTTAYFQRGGDLDPRTIDALIDERNAARAAKNFTRADEIRQELADLGVELEDTTDGTRWKRSGD